MNRLSMLASAAALAALAAMGGCVAISSGTTTKTYDIAGFDSVSARAGVNVVLRQGPFDIRAEGPEHKLDKLVIERQGSVLVISREPDANWFGWSDADLVTVVAPGFASIEASGGADVDIEPLRQTALNLRASGGADVNAGGLTLESLTITASGGADVNAPRVALGTLMASASGGADIDLAGQCKSLTAETSGGADFRGAELRCESATVTATGGGDAEATATAFASGRASSGGDIRFYGNPARFEKEESAGGDVTTGL
jgi:hypothetical protein